MEDEIEGWLKKGYRIVARGDDWAQLLRPKAFSYVWFALWFVLVLALGGILYMAYYLAKRDSAVYLRLEPGGGIYGFEYKS